MTTKQPWPIPPPATGWRLPDPRFLPSEQDSPDLIALGGDLQPGTLLAAYRLGLFPMHVSTPFEVVGQDQETPPARSRQRIGWWSPDPRGIVELSDLRITRSLRQSKNRFRCTVNHAFDEVMAGCADRRRDNGWINDDVSAAYGELHRMGWAHSIEVWERSHKSHLVGGLYGVAVGGLFAGESMFHVARDASKVALVFLVDLLREAGQAESRLLDVQWLTEHLASLGASEVPRAAYLERLDRALEVPIPARLLTHP